jgi:hypothetical protein
MAAGETIAWWSQVVVVPLGEVPRQAMSLRRAPSFIKAGPVYVSTPSGLLATSPRPLLYLDAGPPLRRMASL